MVEASVDDVTEDQVRCWSGPAGLMLAHRPAGPPAINLTALNCLAARHC